MIFLKTANIILVYKYIRMLEDKENSSVYSWLRKPLTRLANALQDFVLSLGRLRLRELFLDRKVVLSICGGGQC
jgi:hypothetical protein